MCHQNCWYCLSFIKGYFFHRSCCEMLMMLRLRSYKRKRESGEPWMQNSPLLMRPLQRLDKFICTHLNLPIFISPEWKAHKVSCPSSVCHRPHFQTWISLKPVGQSLSNFMCSIKGCIRFWGRLDQNSRFHGNRKPLLTYNGENDVSTFSWLFLIWSFLYLQVTRTCIKS